MTPRSDDVATLPVRFTGSYRLMEVPPRCRRPRPVEHEADFTLPVRSVTDDQAPIAITYTEHPDTAETVLRFYDRQLYKQATHYPRQPWPGRGERHEVATEYDSDGFPAHRTNLRTSAWDTVASLEHVKAEHAAYLATYLVVDGLVWKRASEPRYVVAGKEYRTFGQPPGAWIDLSVADHDTSDDARHIFRADQHDAALADAVALARRLGVAQERISELAARAAQITVHVPAAVQLVIPEQEDESLSDLRSRLSRVLYDAHAAMTGVRSQYGDPATNARHAGEFAEAFEQLTDLHRQIRVLTDDVVGVHAVRRPYMPQDLEPSSATGA